MKIINKDITTITSGVIIHSTNCQGVMGSGVALAIKTKWPKVEDRYQTFIANFKARMRNNHIWSSEVLLGETNHVKISKELSVINLFGQEYYGRDGKRYTSYAAWERALPKIKGIALDRQIYFPYLVGCALGGGDWRIISAMIEEYFPNAIFCKI